MTPATTQCHKTKPLSKSHSTVCMLEHAGLSQTLEVNLPCGKR